MKWEFSLLGEQDLICKNISFFYRSARGFKRFPKTFRDGKRNVLFELEMNEILKSIQFLLKPGHAWTSLESIKRLSIPEWIIVFLIKKKLLSFYVRRIKLIHVLLFRLHACTWVHFMSTFLFNLMSARWPRINLPKNSLKHWTLFVNVFNEISELRLLLFFNVW